MALAERIPPVAVRLRRDFAQVLNLIRAHAMLHQAARKRDVAGRIVATLDDYEVVRDLLADIISEGVEATVSPAIRETVETTRRIRASGSDEVSITQLAQALGLDTSAASRRAASAVRQGFLRNLEDRKGRPARLCLGEPIPEPPSILPSREVLHGCSVGRGKGRGRNEREVPAMRKHCRGDRAPVVSGAAAVAQGLGPFWSIVVERPQPMRPIVGEFSRREDHRRSNSAGLGACKGHPSSSKTQDCLL